MINLAYVGAVSLAAGLLILGIGLVRGYRNDDGSREERNQ